jgi:hypothetical protein
MVIKSREYQSPTDSQTSSTYSPRQTEITTSFLEKVRQIFQQRNQQNLDNPTE